MSFRSISLFLLLLLLCRAAAQRRSPNITLGSSLIPTAISSWPSPSGLFSFGFFPQHVDSYAVGVFISSKIVVWTAKRDSNPTLPNDVVALHLTTDGRLILRRSGGADVDVISSFPPIASASMLDNGNFVLYDSGSRVIWQSFDYPTNTLLPGQRLQPAGKLFSSASDTDYNRGIFRLEMQKDGNLVQYPADAVAEKGNDYYASDTYNGGPNVSLNLDNDGRLYLLNGSAPLKNLFTGGLPTKDSLSLMRLDVGGIFRIYTISLNPLGNLTIKWSSTDDACAPKGFCGFNAFCIQMDNVPACQCLPGFEFLQPGNFTAGCSLNFSEQGCPKIDGRMKYEIRAVENTAWEDNAYQNLAGMSEDECRDACLNDCNCEAAFFDINDSRCRKQRLPLKFGRRSGKFKYGSRSG